MSEDMKAVFEALLPPGEIWKPAPDGDFDRLLQGMGDNYQPIYDFAEALAHLRDPRRTEALPDLEKEYGLLTNLQLTEAERRTQLAAQKYAKPDTASDDLVQDKLRAAGFDNIVVTSNDPAIDPALITGALLVNGPIYTEQSPAYLAQAGGDNMYAGNARAVAGYFLNIRRTAHVYDLPTDWRYWRFVVFVGGAASGWPGSPAVAIYTVDANKEQYLNRLILAYRPLHTWIVLVVDYVYQHFTQLIFDNDTVRYVHNPVTNVVTGPFTADVLATMEQGGHIYGQFETASKNFLDVDPLDFSAWALIGGASVTTDVIASPEGTVNADRITFTAAAGDGIKAAISTVGDNEDITHSVFVKTESGTKDFRLQFLKKDGAPATSGDLTATTGWQRFDFLADILSGGTTPEVRILNDSGGAAGSIVCWCSQPEEKTFPTSPILGSLQERDEDKAHFPAADVVEQMRSGEHTIIWIPKAASTDMRTDQFIYKLRDPATGYYVQVYVVSNDKIFVQYNVGGGTVTAVGTTNMVWAQHSINPIVLKPAEGSIWLPHTSGGGKVIGTPWDDKASAASKLHYGSGNSSYKPVDAFLSLPLKQQ